MPPVNREQEITELRARLEVLEGPRCLTCRRPLDAGEGPHCQRCVADSHAYFESWERRRS